MSMLPPASTATPTMPFLNGQYANQRGQGYDSSAFAVPPSIASLFAQQAAGAQQQSTTQQPVAPQAFQSPQLPTSQSTAPTIAPLPSLPTLPNYDDYVQQHQHSFLSSLLPWTTQEGDVPDTVNLSGYHKDRATYLSARDDRLNAILASLDPATAAQAKDQFSRALANLESDGGKNAAGKVVPWHDLTRTEQLKSTSALYDDFENNYGSQYYASAANQSSASTNPRLTYTPQEQAAIQAIIGQFITPYAEQSANSAKAASGLFNELAGQPGTSPSLAAMERAQGGAYQAGGDALAQAYVAQAQSLPAMFALQQNQSYANQIASLQNQLAAQQANQQQTSSAPDLSALLAGGASS